MGQITHIKGGELQHYNPEKGLKNIAVANAAVSHFARAKDTEQLREAIECKLREQARYVVWRDAQGSYGGDRKSSSRKRDLDLPESDPGKDIIFRWRKKLCSKDDNKKTYANDDKIEIATAKAVEKCIKACEGAPRIPKDEPEEEQTSQTEAEPEQIECDDCANDEERWQRSLENFASHSASMRGLWKKLFGEWENFEASTVALTLAEQAAAEWADVVRHLQSRRKSNGKASSSQGPH